MADDVDDDDGLIDLRTGISIATLQRLIGGCAKCAQAIDRATSADPSLIEPLGNGPQYTTALPGAPRAPLTMACVDWYEMVVEHRENPNFDVQRLIEAGDKLAALAAQEQP